MITTRQTIADALTTVDGLTGYAKRPDVLGEGVGYALVQQVDRGPGQAFQTTWRVFVLLSGDEYAALDQLDDFAVKVPAALHEVLFVDSITPYAITTDAGEFFGFQLIARSE
ncbi:hypothetical protein GCM10009804_03140 [Kribbella hippodromi]|uniref:Uncharacterized protein n=1 Tax=Kribbella hippodromi TaxID=434347 RepID=A0ABP4MT40_9ACTN